MVRLLLVTSLSNFKARLSSRCVYSLPTSLHHVFLVWSSYSIKTGDLWPSWALSGFNSTLVHLMYAIYESEYYLYFLFLHLSSCPYISLLVLISLFLFLFISSCFYILRGLSQGSMLHWFIWCMLYMSLNSIYISCSYISLLVLISLFLFLHPSSYFAQVYDGQSTFCEVKKGLQPATYYYFRIQVREMRTITIFSKY